MASKPVHPQPDQKKTPQRERSSSRPTILLVEDNVFISSVVGEVLEERGYRVLLATSAPDAIHQFNAAKSEVDLLLCDVALPGRRSGLEVMDTLTPRAPAMKTIMMSGYLEQSLDVAEHRLRPTFLAKPFSMAKMLEVVRAELRDRFPGESSTQQIITA